MRHIPEDELHAYLDQGLSRSQCVEIESHLAVCASCQGTRDGIAALRDRTTALLARLAPPRTFPTPFDALRRRADVEVSARRRRIHRMTWAASIVAAVAFGWTASHLTDAARFSDRIASASPASAPVAASRQGVANDSPAPATTRAASLRSTQVILRERGNDSTEARPKPSRRVSQRTAVQTSRVSIPPVTPPAQLELSTVDIASAAGDFELHGMWRTMSWLGAQEATGDKLPHIDGLPVVQVQVQAGQRGRQPLMVVAQQLSSGEVIRTIEGPAVDVSHLLAQRTMSDPDLTTSAVDSSRASTDRYQGAGGTMAMQRGDRMIAITGALPADSLLAMIRRLNAEMRSK
jgi:hypothetical protein